MMPKIDLNMLKEMFKEKHIGEFPENDLEQEIFTELDLMDSNLYGQLTNKRNYPPFDLKYPKECIARIENYISQLGESHFKKNKTLFEWYKLCLDAIKIMENYQNERQIKKTC